MSTSIFKDHKKNQQPLDGTVISGAHDLLNATTHESPLATTKGENFKHFQCHMLNKRDQQTPYILQIGDGVIKVLSIPNGTVKATLSLE